MKWRAAGLRGALLECEDGAQVQALYALLRDALDEQARIEDLVPITGPSGRPGNRWQTAPARVVNGSRSTCVTTVRIWKRWRSMSACPWRR